MRIGWQIAAYGLACLLSYAWLRFLGRSLHATANRRWRGMALNLAFTTLSAVLLILLIPFIATGRETSESLLRALVGFVFYLGLFVMCGLWLTKLQRSRHFIEP
jgi:hypothetical protein